jgi:hypothetical protein
MKMVRPNKKITKRNANVMYAPPNTQDNTRGIIPGLTAGTTYGEGQDIKEQVQATGGLPDASLATSTAQPRSSKSMPQMDVFAGTQRPNEPVTSGLPFGAGVGPQEPIADDPDMLLRAIYSVYPDPLLLRLLRNKSV